MNKAVAYLERRFNNIWEKGGSIWEADGVKYFSTRYDGPGPLCAGSMIKLKAEPEGIFMDPYQWSARGISGGEQTYSEQNHVDAHIHFEFMFSDIDIEVEDALWRPEE